MLLINCLLGTNLRQYNTRQPLPLEWPAYSGISLTNQYFIFAVVHSLKSSLYSEILASKIVAVLFEYQYHPDKIQEHVIHITGTKSMVLL